MKETYPAFPLLPASNRKNKRAMVQEFNRFTLKTGEVEMLFAGEVLRRTPDSYEKTYLIYLDLYRKKIEYINKTLRPKYIQMNPDYFLEMYRGVTAGVVYRFIHHLHEFARGIFPTIIVAK